MLTAGELVSITCNQNSDTLEFNELQKKTTYKRFSNSGKEAQSSTLKKGKSKLWDINFHFPE